ncbi:MAG: CocE/NonD family hydrolase [Pedobacter sp.]|nr:MAG: CocE/NonD family hydrolase [Pedobacter sp.]
MKRPLSICLLLLVSGFISAQERNTLQDTTFTEANYLKIERKVPMRDGTLLFTTIYLPKDQSKKYPFLICRTPYSVAPYGEKLKIPAGPNRLFDQEGFIFVYQDIRGKYMSEGQFVANRPYIVNKKGKQTDESSDTYDTIDWLLKNVVMGSFSFLSSFGQQRDSISTKGAAGFSKYGTTDSYRFYMDAGPLKNFNEKFLHGKSMLWNEMMAHESYDDYWKARTPIPHLKKIKPAVLTVGGWFDQEDPYGPLKVYEGLELAKPKNDNTLVMGPWYHGSWSRKDGDVLAGVNFGSKTGEYYRREIELPFFVSKLKGGEDPKLPKAIIFQTGSNEWKRYANWPPADAVNTDLYLQPGNKLTFTSPKASTPGFSEYLSDPDKPVPFSEDIKILRGFEYMVENQRFAFMRPDVLSFETEVLEEDVTIAGHLTADLFVTTTGTDADFIVKLIDVAPNNGYQLMVRGEVMRAKFRNDFSKPEAMVPGKVTEIKFDMQDASHAFLKGHKIMVQIQSSWFPLVDRNPQTFTNIYTADESAFQKATQGIYFTPDAPSHIKLQVIPKP